MICEDHFVGYWNDGYEFQPLWSSSVEANYETKPITTDFKWFKYCPDCGQKLET